MYISQFCNIDSSSQVIWKIVERPEILKDHILLLQNHLSENEGRPISGSEMICYVSIRLQADSPVVTVTPFLTETEAFSGPTPTPWSTKSTTPIFRKLEDPCETPPVLFSLFSSHRHFDDKDMTVGSMVIDCGNGIIKKDPDAEGGVCNEDLATDENTEGSIQEDVDNQEGSTSEEFEAEENVEEDIRSDLDEQGNAISEETKKLRRQTLRNIQTRKWVYLVNL